VTKKFSGQIIKLASSGNSNAAELNWKVVDVPFDVKKTYGRGGTVPVTAKVNGFSYRTSLFPRKNGPHFLLLNKRILKGADAALGDTVKVEVELDTEKRTATTPALLKKALVNDPDLLEYFESFSYSMRKYIGEFLTQPKSVEAKQRRLDQIVTTLFEMRDGEQTPPPILQAEFAHNPKAKRGWEKMPTSHKRSHLWGIFYYRPGAARERRIEKAVQAMIEYDKKKSTA
jgi:uncharacterized protein YdeI (YjbR/CyaY-like superfamily)